MQKVRATAVNVPANKAAPEVGTKKVQSLSYPWKPVGVDTPPDITLFLCLYDRCFMSCAGVLEEDCSWGNSRACVSRPGRGEW